MILKYDLDNSIIDALKLREGEEIYYAVKYDISHDKKWLANSYVVVTAARVVIIEEGKLARELDISGIKYAKSEPQIGCGVLVVNDGKEDLALVQFSASHLARYAYIARGINILASGRTEKVVSTEYEKICPKCGRAIPGMKECPSCSKESGFWKNFLNLCKPYSRSFGRIIFLMIMASVVTLLNPEVQKYLVDDVLKSEGSRLQTAMICLGIMFLLSISIVIINVLKQYFCTLLGTQMSGDLREKLFTKIQLLSLSYINDRRPGELINRIVIDTRAIKEFMERTFCNMFTVCFIFVCDVIYMLVLNAKLALISFILVPVAVGVTYSVRKAIHRRFHLQRRKEDDISSSLQDVLQGMRVVKSYGKEEDERVKFNKLAEEIAVRTYNNEMFWCVVEQFVGFIMNASVFLVIFVGGRDVLGGSMTTGELLQFITYTRLLYQYLNWMTSMPRDLMSLISSIERINDVLGQELDVEENILVDESSNQEIQGEIVFKHATFGYKSYQPVLEDINLHIKQGEMIGIVGASGTGKSTLINLIMRLYNIDDGEIFVDGREISDIPPMEYHSKLGVVLQETFLFSGTILSNIRFSRPDATLEEVI
ncbi:MAG: ABC transporter ATP-binding protein/permease, partial [Eubacterium sp.]|nr:ABC transporter ATP-binding protein/permease [Eubacterium sp.]